MSKYLTQLQIVKRGDLYVVQIRRQRFFTRRWYWVDMHDYLRTDLSIANKPIKRTGYQPFEPTKFNTHVEATKYCTKYLGKASGACEHDIVVESFNTCGIPDIAYRGRPRMPNVKRPLAPIHRDGQVSNGPPPEGIKRPPPPPTPPPKRIMKDTLSSMF